MAPTAKPKKKVVKKAPVATLKVVVPMLGICDAVKVEGETAKFTLNRLLYGSPPEWLQVKQELAPFWVRSGAIVAAWLWSGK